MEQEFRILKLIPSILDAIQCEIDQLKNTRHEVVLFEGRLKQQIDRWFIYQFELPEGTYLRFAEETEIYIGREQQEKVEGELVSIDNQFITLKLSKNLGENIPHLTVVWHSDIILRKLSERINTIKDNPKNYYVSTIERLFYPINAGNLSKWEHSLLLPSKSFPTDSQPKDFNVNPQQQQSLEKSLINKITFIWGPPGTGKTQTLGIITYNLIRGGKRILFSSNTNRAVDNGVLAVIDRYKDHGGEFIKDLTRYGQIALFENEDLQKVSFEKQVEALREERRKQLEDKISLLSQYKDAKENLILFKKQISRITELNQTISLKKGELEAIVLKLKNIDIQIKKFDQAGFIASLKNMLTGATKENLQKQFLQLQKNGQALKLSINEFELEKESIQKNTQGFEAALQKFKVMKNQVDKLGGEDTLAEEIERGLTIDESVLLKEKKFVGATLAKIIMNDPFWYLRYDVLLIDEASMVNLPYLVALAALSIEKVIIVGDPQQLPPIALSKNTESKKWFENDIYMFAGQSSSVEELFRWNEKNPQFTVFLNTQYRMASDLCSLISEFFYEGKLLNGVNEQNTSGNIVFADTSQLLPVTKKLQGRGFLPYNEIHAIRIIEAIKHAIALGRYEASQIGVILPFKGSVQYVRELLRQEKLKNIEVGTVYTFQGREKDVIIFDTVMAGVDYTVRPYDETKTSPEKVSRLLNVALSRAKKDIYIIADMRHFQNMYSGKIIHSLLIELEKRSAKSLLEEETIIEFEEMDETEKERLLGF